MRAYCNRKFYRKYNAPQILALHGSKAPPPGGRQRQLQRQLWRRHRRTVESLMWPPRLGLLAIWILWKEVGLQCCRMAFAFNSIHPSILAAAFSSSYTLRLISWSSPFVFVLVFCISTKRKKIIGKKRDSNLILFGVTFEKKSQRSIIIPVIL